MRLPLRRRPHGASAAIPPPRSVSAAASPDPFSVRSIPQGIPSLEEVGALLTCAADLSYCTICACYQSQHKLQLDARDEGRYVPPVFQPPPVEVMTGYQAFPQQGYPTMYR